MVIWADIPPDLTGDDSAYMFQFLDAQLNCGTLYALLHGGWQPPVSRHVSADR